MVASHPALPWDRYLHMLARVCTNYLHIKVIALKVLSTSIPVMLFFSLFIGGFSMAFYLILQEVGTTLFVLS